MLSPNFKHTVYPLNSMLFAEVVSCQIPHPAQLHNVFSVVRSPTSPEADNEQFFRAVRLVANQPGICLIIGDFNAPHQLADMLAFTFRVKLPKRNSYFRPFSRPPDQENVTTHHSSTSPLPATHWLVELQLADTRLVEDLRRSF